jgi:hypothetical protein
MISAFKPAATYLSLGLDLLDPVTRWDDHYDLSLKLFASMAQMCFCAGQIDQCEFAVKEVLDHAKLIDDSISVYLVWTQCLAAQAKYHDLVSTSLDLLKQLGELLSPNSSSFQSRRIFAKTKRRLTSISNEEILGIPLMQNQRKMAAV